MSETKRYHASVCHHEGCQYLVVRTEKERLERRIAELEAAIKRIRDALPT